MNLEVPENRDFEGLDYYQLCNHDQPRDYPEICRNLKVGNFRGCCLQLPWNPSRLSILVVRSGFANLLSPRLQGKNSLESDFIGSFRIHGHTHHSQTLVVSKWGRD
ncbi:hypothetical protein Y032_0883g2848 [Ancylostoma ceylanicum]|uniref:Uncharacterized protein n=1 Tax=Ancylostoma ceylanicum TaxID=53326 RepID=A0A016WAF7_9BILA|nr:hypothetical protein Y032_0883g2848 [Ancylostoma ceylanicum]